MAATLEKISDKNVWQTLKESTAPAVLYGMGNGAEKIIAALNNYGVDVNDIFASDGFVRGHSFLGKKVLSYGDICKKYESFNVILAFAVHDEEMLRRIKEINKSHPVFAPDVPVTGGGLFTREYVELHEKAFDTVYNSLADERSKEVYLDIIRFKIGGKVDYLYMAADEKSGVYSDILKLNNNEVILDLGAYDGDTVSEITAFAGGYRHITAIEPDEKNFKKLLKNTHGMNNINCLNIGIWNEKTALKFDSCAGRNSRLGGERTVECDCIDNICTMPPTMIKMDIEGSEMQALEGGEQAIGKYLPKLYICAYHRNEDMFALPLKIWEISKSYKIYFRHSPYVPAWESNFYCTAEGCK